MIEAMVGVAISGIVAIAVLTALQAHNKAQSTNLKNMEMRQVFNLIQMYLGSTNSCRELFSSLTINTPVVPNAPARTLSGNSYIGISGLYFKGSEIAQINVIKNGLKPIEIGFNKMHKSYPASGGGFRYYLLDFKIEFEKIGDTYGSQSTGKTYEVYFKTDLNGKVIACGNPDASEEGRCVRMGKTFDLSRFPFCQ